MNAIDWLNSERTIKKSKKSYAHFDWRTDLQQQKAYVSDSKRVAVHGFYPLIHYQIKMVKFRKTKGRKEKTRDICYAAHIDRCIYQYYCFLLSEAYNERVRRDGISNVAVAYRTDLRQSNIHFAKQAFDFMKRLGSCHIMIGDFTNFFDSLDHQYLKQQWCSLMGYQRLPDDHYNVFKNITAYSKWELEDLLWLNGLNNTPAGIRSLNHQARVLPPEQFKQHRSHIQKNSVPYGIPQGSPISAVLANVYMLEVDKLIHDAVEMHGGMYMRYSDDFIIILPDDICINTTEAFIQIRELLKRAPRLTLQPEKTQYFRYHEGTLINCGKDFHADADDSSRYINFLGFTFDGTQVSIRPKTITKYYYRMYRKAKNIAYAGGYTPEGNHISGENLYQRYSERGAKGKPGNFLTYVARSEKEFGVDEAVTRDTKRHMMKIRKALKRKSKRDSPETP